MLWRDFLQSLETHREARALYDGATIAAPRALYDVATIVARFFWLFDAEKPKEKMHKMEQGGNIREEQQRGAAPEVCRNLLTCV